jgi:hypothetical protein
MRIIKYSQYYESRKDPPEEYVNTILMKMKKELDSLFEDEGVEEPVPGGEDPIEGEPKDRGESLENARERSKRKDKGDMSLLSQGVRLESSEFSNHSAMFDSLILKFSTPEGWYSLYITIPLEDVVDVINGQNGDDQGISDIQECSVKLKGYSSDDRLIGRVGPKNVKIEEVGEKLLINMKIELDSKFGDEETLEFET